MILNILYLAITSFMINDAIINNHKKETITKYTSYSLVAGFSSIVGNTFFKTLDGSTSIAIAIIYVFSFHILRIISIINTNNHL
jgi:hypothetical protein